MNDKRRVIPMPIPGIGGGQQLPFDLKQAERKVCKACGWEIFEKVYRMGIISQFAQGNKTQMDVTVEYPAYVCRACGWEFNVEVLEEKH